MKIYHNIVRRLGVDGMKWPARPRQDLPGGAGQPGDDIEREREREIIIFCKLQLLSAHHEGSLSEPC